MLQLEKNKGAKAGAVAASVIAIGSLFGLVQRESTPSTTGATASVLAAQQTPTPIRTAATSPTGPTAAATSTTTATTTTTNTRTHVS
jgi:hypothetical protein